VRGIERAAALLGRRLEDEDLLVIGATGDVGSGCAWCLRGRVRRLLLAGRNSERLEREAAQLHGDTRSRRRPTWRPCSRGRPRIFRGGMGVLAGGLRSVDGLLERFYCFPVRNAAHGCMIEGAVLAMAGRLEAFSQGRGYISPARVQEMWRLARECGVLVAPLFDGTGVWDEETLS